MRRPSIRDDHGETLVELLVTIVIMSTAVIALVAAIAASIGFSDLHRKQSNAGAYVRAFAESIEKSVAAYPTGYVDCATTSSYTYTAPTGYSAGYSIEYWSGTAFTSACTTDHGVQRLTLQVSSADGRANETLTIVIRKPCRSATDFPQDWPCTA